MEAIQEVYGHWGKFKFYLIILIFSQKTLVTMHMHLHLAATRSGQCDQESRHPACTGDARLNAEILIMGVIFGHFICGFMADWYGRIRTITIGLALLTIIGTSLAFIETYEIFIAFRFFEVAIGSSLLLITLVLMLETIAYKLQFFWTFLYIVSYNFGFTLILIVIQVVKNYAYLQLTISLASIVFLMAHLFVPEPLLWLLAAGKETKAWNAVFVAAGMDNISIEKLIHKEKLIKKMSPICPKYQLPFATILRQQWRPLLALAVNDWATGLGFSRVQEPLNNMLRLKSKINHLGVLRSLVVQMASAFGLLHLHSLIGWRTILIVSNVTTLILEVYLSIDLESFSYKLGAEIITNVATGIIFVGMAFHYCYLAETIPTRIRCRVVCITSTSTALAEMFWTATSGRVMSVYTIVSVISSIFAIFACYFLPATTGRPLPINEDDMGKNFVNEISSSSSDSNS